MVLPIKTGKVYTQQLMAGPIWGWYASVQGERQAKPVDRPLNYTSQFSSAKVKRLQGSLISAFGATDSHNYLPSGFIDAPLKAAYEKMRDKVMGDGDMSIGATMGELNQTRTMVVDSCTTLLRAARSVSKGHFGNAAKILRMKIAPKGANPLKSLSQNWLEFHLGWEPLAKEIYGGMEILSRPPPATKARGSGMDVYRKVDVVSWAPPNVTQVRTFNHVCHVYIGAEFRLDSPNLHLLDKAGLANPASVAWELVPFSFVIDWFVDVGDCLRRFSDFLGCTVFGQYYGWKTVVDWKLDAVNYGSIQETVGEHVYADRKVGWPSSLFLPKLKIPKQWSLQRGATAASLLALGLRDFATKTPRQVRKTKTHKWDDVYAAW